MHAVRRLPFVPAIALPWIAFTALLFLPAVSLRAQTPLQLTRIASGQFSLSYPSTAGIPYRLQSSIDLRTWSFTPVAALGTGATAQHTVTGSTPAAFWRVAEFPADTAYKPLATPGPFAVAPFADETWFDSARSYSMPVRIYAPALAHGSGPFPVVILSHGLAGSIGAFDTLSNYLTSHGYLCVMIEHADTRPDSRIERPKDVSFTVDILLGSPTNPLLAGRIDSNRVAHAGHSFGAFTTLAVLGARYHQDDASSPVVSFPDTRIKCGVALSPQGATILGLFSGSWDNITRPSLTLHGTLDFALGTPDPASRRQPYDEMPAGNKAHLTLTGGEHEDFSDTGIAAEGDRFTRWYFPATLAFLDANLKNDPTAREWLDALALTRLSAGLATLETK
jgi:predicted dienelactone hydrolase